MRLGCTQPIYQYSAYKGTMPNHRQRRKKMENEKELSEQPYFDDTSIESNDSFEEIDNDVIESMKNGELEEDSSLDGDKPVTTNDESNKQEVDYTPFLNAIKEKARYNKEPVQVDSIDDVISNFQKGLNYDKLLEQKKALENSRVFSYINDKAKQLGMTPDEYMNSIDQYEKEQRQAKEQQKIDEMISNGVPEDVAKEVVATAELRRQLQIKENELKSQEKEKQDKLAKEKEYQDFLEAFPDVKAEDIPKEVFLNAQKSNLKTAYLEYQNAELKKQLEISKTNSKNKQTSVGSVTEYGNAEGEQSDPFLEGFNSV